MKNICTLFIVLSFALASCSDEDSKAKPISKLQDSIVNAQFLNSPHFYSPNVHSRHIKFSAQYFEKENSNTYNIVDSAKEFNILVKNFYRGESLDTRIPADFITVLKKRYYLDSIVHRDCPECTPPLHGILKLALYSQSTKNKYISLFFENTELHTSDLCVFLIQLDKQPQIRCLGYTVYNPDKLFYDSNKNGELEYLFLNETIDTMFLKEVTPQKINLIPDKHLLINSLDDNGYVFIIDYKHSSWRIQR